jgi:hypothetical protein
MKNQLRRENDPPGFLPSSPRRLNPSNAVVPFRLFSEFVAAKFPLGFNADLHLYPTHSTFWTKHSYYSSLYHS